MIGGGEGRRPLDPERIGRDLRVQENRIVVPPGGIERGEGKVRVRSRKGAPSTKIAMKLKSN